MKIKKYGFRDRVEYRLEGQPHREDGPAVIYKNGIEEWRQHGKLHRLDGPAMSYPDGHSEWFKNGMEHRLGGPAIEFSDGSEEWWTNGIRHRIGGPAISYRESDDPNATTVLYEYYVNGRYHRDDGPAVIRSKNRIEWWLNGCNLTYQVNEWMKEVNIQYPFNNEELITFKLRWL